MSTIAIPGIDPSRIVLQLARAADQTIRLMNGSKKYVLGTDAEWHAVFAIEPLNLAESKVWKAALVQLAKRGNNFKLPTFGIDGMGSSAGLGFSPVAKGIGQLGTVLLADGVTANTLIAQAGDGLEVNGEFKILTSDAFSDGSGIVAFSFEPALRVAPADNAPIELDKPEITMALDEGVAQWAIRRPEIHEMKISAFEDF